MSKMKFLLDQLTSESRTGHAFLIYNAGHELMNVQTET